MDCLLNFLEKIHPKLRSVGEYIVDITKEKPVPAHFVRQTEPPPRFKALMDFKIQNLWKKKEEEEDPEDVEENKRLEADIN